MITTRPLAVELQWVWLKDNSEAVKLNFEVAVKVVMIIWFKIQTSWPSNLREM